ncbi:hypothetical protein [Frankia sp. EAN1pec]|uniref:hypothetical protein n=1 Tax=Parafrankia sp. (strain EAN1pec) TaxID=298653 RepID=UPI0012F9D047
MLAGLAVRLTDGGRTSPVVIATDDLVDAGTSTLAVHFVCLVVGDVADGQPYFDLRDESIEAGDGALRSHA